MMSPFSASLGPHKGLLGMETHTSLCPTYSLAAAPRAPWGRIPGGPWPVFEIDIHVLARSEQRNSGGDTVLTWLRVTRVAEMSLLPVSRDEGNKRASNRALAI